VKQQEQPQLELWKSVLLSLAEGGHHSLLSFLGACEVKKKNEVKGSGKNRIIRRRMRRKNKRGGK